ncbi:xanthine dehydrogenase accessory protein XdhC [Brachybacterium vulturis]|uniref:Xanthine dehydrogenase accessory protein XdhC n=1 Tax=Brachybacterium vulturis TaxID=2017484 RepID=A0A291GRN0_9MICO|nr:xanthine dehydrogenase accessory protein XdhC [Brachybacterium vulturis]ATG52895.1 xanthine dehydrogenase accessory protein XdhC [Brachybacterium vulturis]
MDWLSALTALRAEGRPAVLVTVTRTRGHAPRDAGAKMLVTEQDSVDTIGGGNLEATVIERAREMLRHGDRRPELMEMKLNPHAPARHGRQCCGGEAEVLLEPQLVAPCVAIFGIGHVGFELAHLLRRHRVALHLVDSRADQVAADRLGALPDGPARVQGHHAPAPETVLRDLPVGAHVLIMTHDHAEDLVLCEAALQRGGELGSVGVIGSDAKWSRFRVQLREAGHEEAAIDRIDCPLGLAGVGGKEPAVIALSAAAALMASLQHAEEAAPAG